MRRRPALVIVIVLLAAWGAGFSAHTDEKLSNAAPVEVRPLQDLGKWEGWGSSLAWWARAIGGTGNSDYFADLLYTSKTSAGYPGLGLNIVRYNVGGGGINQPGENKGPKLQWQMDIHGYWTDANNSDPAGWNWAADLNQRSLMLKARKRGANLFEVFADSPMWWMNSNHSTAGSESGANCLPPENYEKFAFYLAEVARHAVDRWGIRFDSVEPFNEPSADWWKFPVRQEGCHFDVAAQQEVVEKLRRALDQAHLHEVTVAAADENNMDAALSTWSRYDSRTRDLVGQVNVHGYSNGTEPYRGPNRVELRRAVGTRRLWQSEYGDGDASGYTMAQAIIRDLKALRPNAWIYWQPIEPDAPEFGWGLVNADYIDTHDQPAREITPVVRVNRKFFVYGQFTRYLRPGYHLVSVADPDSIAAYDQASRRLVIVTVTGDANKAARFELSQCAVAGNPIQVIATTTHPGETVPDWKQHNAAIKLEEIGHQKLLQANLYPLSVYTFVIALAVSG